MCVCVCCCSGTALRSDTTKYRMVMYLAAFRLQELSFDTFRCASRSCPNGRRGGKAARRAQHTTWNAPGSSQTRMALVHHQVRGGVTYLAAFRLPELSFDTFRCATVTPVKQSVCAGGGGMRKLAGWLGGREGPS
jgi:hypothetical protein